MFKYLPKIYWIKHKIEIKGFSNLTKCNRKFMLWYYLNVNKNKHKEKSIDFDNV